MTITVSITESNIFQALGEFIRSIVPDSVTVVRGQKNRVAQPAADNHIVMWPTTRERISTNTDSYTDIAFTGSISASLLTVTAMIEGSISDGDLLGAFGMLAGTSIVSQLSGTTGGVGTYQVTNTQTLASTTIQAGTRDVRHPVKVTIQVDVHGPSSAEYSQIISTLARDEYGVNFFAGESLGSLGIQPLFTSEPRQIPFMNGEQQSEEKWSVEVTLQANPVVSIPQEYAGTVNVSLIKNVDTYPA